VAADLDKLSNSDNSDFIPIFALIYLMQRNEMHQIMAGMSIPNVIGVSEGSAASRGCSATD
jgi:hypothetical protein